MLDYDEITKIKNLYLQNKNIMKYLRTKRKSKNNSEIIMYSYDLQSGSYFSNRSRKNIQIPYTKLGKDIAKLISKLGAKTVLECGVGEGNSLVQILKNKIENNPKFLGFDISLSRLLYAKKYLCQEKKKNVMFKE